MLNSWLGKPTPQPATSGVPHDPTQPGPVLRELIGPAKDQPKGQELPSIELKGRILGGLQPASALLSINKGFVLVHQGTEITLSGPRLAPQTLHVASLNETEVHLEVMPLRETLVLH